MSSPRPDAPALPRVLVVDDEEPLARLVATYLERDGFEARTCGDGHAAIQLARAWDPGVIVLDVGLPGVDGIEVCRAVRTFSDCYILMLTARADEVDKLVGLSVGADDYVTKPFSPRELLARIRVMLRRPRLGGPLVPPDPAPTTAAAAGPTAGPTTPPPAPDPLRLGRLTLDVEGREVHVDGAPVELTRTEFDVLAALASRPRAVFTRRQLITEVWGEGWVGDDHLVDVHIAHVRRKLGDDPADPVFIRTVRGVGYRMGPGA